MTAFCPNSPDHKEFITSATVIEEWVVDPKGNFLREATSDKDVLHKPNPENSWRCSECGAYAEFKK